MRKMWPPRLGVAKLETGQQTKVQVPSHSLVLCFRVPGAESCPRALCKKGRPSYMSPGPTGNRKYIPQGIRKALMKSWEQGKETN